MWTRSPRACAAASLGARAVASRLRTSLSSMNVSAKAADDIATEYDLTLADVHAALAYYFDHRAEIEERIAESGALIDVLRKENVSRLAEKPRTDQKPDMARIRFFTDEQVSRAVVMGIRRRGVDVLTVPEAGTLGASDAEHCGGPLTAKGSNGTPAVNWPPRSAFQPNGE